MQDEVCRRSLATKFTIATNTGSWFRTPSLWVFILEYLLSCEIDVDLSRSLVGGHTSIYWPHPEGQFDPRTRERDKSVHLMIDCFVGRP